MIGILIIGWVVISAVLLILSGLWVAIELVAELSDGSEG